MENLNYEIRSTKPFKVVQWRGVIARPNFSGFVESQVRQWLAERRIEAEEDLSYFAVFKRDLKTYEVRCYLLFENGPRMWYSTSVGPDPETTLIDSLKHAKSMAL